MDKAGRLTDLMFVIGGVVFDFGWERNFFTFANTTELTSTSINTIDHLSGGRFESISRKGPTSVADS